MHVSKLKRQTFHTPNMMLLVPEKPTTHTDQSYKTAFTGWSLNDGLLQLCSYTPQLNGNILEIHTTHEFLSHVLFVSLFFSCCHT